MAMRLRVVSSQGKQLGERASKVFGVHGGSIGRAADNDWILPDPERYISAHHARIEYREGRYVLLDTSTNGMYVNDGSEPLGKLAHHELKDGDRLRFGDFEVLVSIDASNDFPPDKSAIIAYDGRGTPGSAVAKSTQNDLGESLDLDSLLANDHNGESGSPYGPVDAYGQPIKSPGKRTSLRQSRQQGVKSLLDDQSVLKQGDGSSERGKPWHMSTRPYAASKPGAQAPHKPASGDSQLSASGSRPHIESAEAGDVAGAIQTLCRGAGIPASAIPQEMHGRFLQAAGQLLREMVLGLTATRQSRAELKNRLRIQANDEESSALALSGGVDETLRRLLAGATGRNVTQAEAVRAGFQEIGHHERAIMEAVQAALADVIQRLSPEELEERFARGGKRSSIMGGNVKARNWELYSEFFRGLTQGSGEAMPHVFVEAFARAYESSIRELDGAAGQRERLAGDGS
ncbi:MAG: type VI secretion system-associated FHA domain protein TagH [Steroidobacteraceae bacterium]